MTSKQASKNRWRKGFFGVFSLPKIGCLDLLAGLSYSFLAYFSVTLCHNEGRSAYKKRCRNAPKKLAILKQLRTNLKAKHEKGAGTPFPRVPAPLHPWPVRWTQYGCIHRCQNIRSDRKTR